MIQREPRLSGGVETVAGGEEGLGVLQGVGVRKPGGRAGHLEVGAQGGDPRGIRATGRAQAQARCLEDGVELDGAHFGNLPAPLPGA